MADEWNLAPGLEARDRLDALMHLQWIHFDRFQARRQWEWRLTFTLWGGLVLAANALRGVDLPLLLYWIGVTVITTLHGIWEAFYIRAGAEPNRDFGVLIGQAIGDMVDFTPTGSDGTRSESVKKYNALAAHYWQVGITLILALVVGAVIFWS